MFDLSMQSLAFLSYCKDRKVLSSKTIKAYKTDLSQFEAYLIRNQYAATFRFCTTLSNPKLPAAKLRHLKRLPTTL